MEKDLSKEEGLKCILCGCYEVKKIYSCPGMVIYRCRNCSFMFQDPAEYQKNQNTYMMDSWKLPNPETSLKIARYSLKRITDNLTPPANVLEVGSGSGALGSLFLKNGFTYVGIERSPSLYKLALNHFPELKNNIKNCLLQEARLKMGYFDIIVMIDTLEHIPYPIEFLRNLRQYAKPDALLYLEVPNEASLYIKGAIRRALRIYGNFPTHQTHVNLFTVNTIKKLLTLAGFNQTKVIGIPVLGDFERMKFILGGKSIFIPRLISGFFGITKLDLILGQGNIAAISGVDNQK